MQNKTPKRLQVNKNQTMIFILIAIASVISVVAVMVSRQVWSQASYNSRVIAQKELALEQLEANKEAVASLTSAYNQFNEQNPNLIGGNPSGTGEKDGSNSTLILDSLPSRYDFPAIASSIEKLLNGYNIKSMTGNDDAVAQSTAASGSPVEIPFSFSVETNYDGMKGMISTFDLSIRPFKIQTLSATGTNGNLQVDISVVTYYQPETGVQITQEQVQ